MKFTSVVLATAFLFGAPDVAVATKERDLFKDDETFWERVLTNKYDLVSTPPPTPRPTTAPPTVPPSCLVEVTIACTDSTGLDCASIPVPPPGDTAGCSVEVTYAYTLTNVGDVCMTITEVDRTRGTETVDLIGLVNEPELCVGQSTVVTETETLDICTSGDFTTTVVAKADPPVGVPCEGMDTYSFSIDVIPVPPTPVPTPVPLPCLVEVIITCTDSNGVDCASIPPPPPGSTDDCFVEVTYNYELTNIGDVCMTITEVMRTRGDSTVDLLGLVTQPDLCVAESTTVTETETLDLCTEGEYKTIVVAAADPPIGVPCEGMDMYTINVDATLTPVPTSAVSNLPSGTPSSLPSSLPSDVPSDVPSLVPPTPINPPTFAPVVPSTLAPVASPTLAPIVPSTLAPVTPPTFAPVTPTTLAPVASPTVAPVTPSSVIAPPTSIPVAPPTVAPAAPSTNAPIISSPVPTPITSTFPSLPSDLCFVQVQVDCTPPEGVEDCNSIIEFRAECFEKPYSMGFRFNGGDCSQEFNEQDPQIYQCEDYGGGPPINAGEEAYFIVSDIKGLGVRYFEGSVPVGGLLTMANPNPNLQLDANVNVTIYNSPNITRENILQTMIIHTSCSQVTFLKDRYGSIELLWFNNTVQGNVSCAVDLTLGFTIENIAEGFNAILSSLTSITNFPGNEFINLTEQVSGQTLQPGQSIPFQFGVSLDTSIRQRYTAFSTIQGSSPEGFSCRSTDFLNFTAGNTNAAPFFSISQPPAAAPFAR